MQKTKLLITALLVTVSFTILAQGKVVVKGLPTEDETDLNFYYFKPDRKTNQELYDPRVFGNPSFFPGYLIARNGERIEGEVALFNSTDDWSFVKRYALIIFKEDAKTAHFIGPRDAFAIHQQRKKAEDVYDLYEDGYLKRLVSGKVRLYYNPQAGTSRKVSEFIPVSLIDEVRKNAAEGAMKQSLKDGRSLSESLETVKSNDQVIADIAGSIEITEKEYLLFSSNKTVAITKANYEMVIRNLMDGCPAATDKVVKGYAKNYKKIEDAVIFFNENCQ